MIQLARTLLPWVISLCLSAAVANTTDNTAAIRVVKEDDHWTLRGRVNRLQFNPSDLQMTLHTATRADCLKYRGLCLDFIRSTGGVVSSEEPADWAIPHIDLVHHGPFALDPDPGRGPAMGIPTPLFSLVYHDALLLPWSLDKGAWGIPETDLGYLHGLAHAGKPYLSLQGTDEELRQVRTMCALNARVGLLEMTNHEFLDKSFRRQRTTFADGTTVTIDLDNETFDISPAIPDPAQRTTRKDP